MHPGLNRSTRAGWMALLLCVSCGAASASPLLRFGGGAGYARPSSPEIRDLYGSGPIFFIQQETILHARGIGIGLELGYRRASARLDRPFFVQRAEATIELVPFAAILRIPLARGPAIRPYIGAGIQMLWSRESFDSAIDGERNERKPDGTMDPGWILAGGIERTGSPHPRLELYYGQVNTRRKVTASKAVYDSPGGEEINAGSLGLRASVSFP